MILGLHCPVVSGFPAALDRALSARCRAMQMLPYRRHGAAAAEDFEGFSRRRRRGGVKVLLIHSRFVPSLASSDPARRRRSIELLAGELTLAARWEAEGFVLHAGAYSPQETLDQGLRLAADAIVEASLMASKPVPLLLENVPGGGRRMGGGLEELAALVEAVAARRKDVFACLDTAHAWAAGYDVSGAEGMLRFLSRVHRLLGAQNVAAFHLNDSRALLGSHREDHARWGEGRLGLEGLRVLLGREEYAAAAGILETPPGPDDAAELSRLEALA